MSKNFELSQQTGKFQEMLYDDTRTGVQIDDNGPCCTTPGGMARDEVNKLIYRLFLLPGTPAPGLVVFTGTEAGNGCTWMCAHAGEALASRVSGSVCVLDCNLRAPTLHQQLGVNNHYGLSESLRQSGPIRQYLSPLPRANFWLLSSGSLVDNAKALLTSDRMKARLNELRKEFDYLIVDAPPLSACKDSIFLGSSSDGVVLILKANVSRRDIARKVLGEFHTAAIPVLGTVLNRRTFPIPEAIYHRL